MNDHIIATTTRLEKHVQTIDFLTLLRHMDQRHRVGANMETASSPFKSRKRLDESSGFSSSLLLEECSNIHPHHSDPLLTTMSIKDAKSSTKSKSGFESRLSTQWHKWQRKIPLLKKVQELVLRVPPRVRMGFVFFWFCWKIAFLLAFLIVLMQQEQQQYYLTHSSISSNILSNTNRHHYFSNNMNTNATKVLYIVTTLTEYNNGKRRTIKGQDRFLYGLLPVMIDSVEKMVENPDHNLQVDVFLICAYKLKPEREDMIRQRLPTGVGFQYWDDALPLSYEPQSKKEPLKPNTRALARQHRYVVRDKLEYYDMFVAFEDDMLVRGHHVHHFWQLSLEIERLRIMAPEIVPDDNNGKGDMVDDVQKTKFFGSMSKQQLERVVPGFIRVEVMVNGTERPAPKEIFPIFPIDHDFGLGLGGHRDIDPSLCCHVHLQPSEGNISETPPVEDLVVWETNIKAFSIREFPSGSALLDWAVLMMGPGRLLPEYVKIGEINWSGRRGRGRRRTGPGAHEP